MKINRKFLIIILSLLIVIGMVSILVSRNIATKIIKQQTTNNLINTIQSRAEHIKTFLNLKKETVKQLSTDVIIEELLLSEKEEENYFQKLDEVIRRLKYTAQTGEYNYDIFFLDVKGTIVASSNEEDMGKDKSDDSYFLEGKERVFIRDVYISSYKQRITLAFSAPILTIEDNRFLGVVVLMLFPEALFRITTERTGLGKTGETYLVNKDGYMISPSRFIDDVILKQKVDPIYTEEENSVSPDTLLKEKIATIKDYRGIEVLSVHTHIPEMGWHLIAEIDVQDAFAPIAQMTNILIFLFVIILFISLFISIFVSNSITRPIRRLYKGIEEVTEGNLDFKVGTPSLDEVGQLSRAFDEMTDNLKKSREELEEYSKNLEKKVEERTRDLEIDISKRKKVEASLYKSQQEFDSLFRNSPEASVYVDEKGNILDINHRFFEVFGYTLKEIKGKNLNSGIIHPPDKIEEGKKLRIKGLKGHFGYKTIRKKKDGTLFPVSISVTSFVIDGKLKGEIIIYIDITKQVQNEERLQDYLKEIKKDRKNLKRLSKKLINAQEEERQKISEIIHDDIGQNITAIKINILVIEEAINKNNISEVKGRLTETKSLLEQAFEQLRKLNIDLRSPLLRDLGLLTALRTYVNKYKKREDIDIDFEVINLKKRLNKEMEIVIFRIVQEAFTNISKHAGADNIYLRLENKKSKVCVSIKDNGKGFNTKNVRDLEELGEGLGLIEIRERIETIGGNLDIKSSLGIGTQLLIEIPVGLEG